MQAEEKSGLIELGADEYLRKPFDQDELLARMQRALQLGQWLGIGQAAAPTPKKTPR